MLSQEDIKKTLADLADGVARLTHYFETPAAAPVVTAPVVEAAPPALVDQELEAKRKQLEELEKRASQAESREAAADQNVRDLEGNRDAIRDRIKEEEDALARL